MCSKRMSRHGRKEKGREGKRNERFFRIFRFLRFFKFSKQKIPIALGSGQIGNLWPRSHSGGGAQPANYGSRALCGYSIRTKNSSQKSGNGSEKWFRRNPISLVSSAPSQTSKNFPRSHCPLWRPARSSKVVIVVLRLKANFSPFKENIPPFLRNHFSPMSAEFTSTTANQTAAHSSTPISGSSNSYHSPLCGLLTWKDPVATGKVFGALVAALVLVKINFVSFALHVLYLALLASAAAEYAGKLVTGQGFITKYLGTTPESRAQTFRKSVLPAIGDAMGAAESHIYKVVFAQDIEATLKAAGAAYIAYKLTSWFSVYALACVSVLLAFSVPPVYMANKKEIDAAVAHYTKIARAKTAEFLELAHKKAAPHLEAIAQKTGPLGSFIQSKFPTRTAGSTVNSKHAASVPEPTSGVSSGSQFPLVPKDTPVGATEVDDLLADVQAAGEKAGAHVPESVPEPTL